MGPSHHPAVAGTALVAAACVLAACGNAPAPRAVVRMSTTTTSTTTTTLAPPTTATAAGSSVAVPDVLGMKLKTARLSLRAVGFVTVPFNTACNKGTLASQSVVAALSVAGNPPDVHVGALPLVPGSTLPRGARVGITWSGCYPDGAVVPPVVGQTFSSAVHLLHLAGLNWACYSAGSAPTTTTHPDPTTSPSGPTSTSTPATTTTTTKPRQTILSQGTPAGTTVRAGTVVDLVMHHCPQ
ncbi:MAG TPA: hypothetical protein VGG09_07645 [Acidimicrobiales bacterium]